MRDRFVNRVDNQTSDTRDQTTATKYKHIEPSKPHRPGRLNGFHGHRSGSIVDPTMVTLRFTQHVT